MNDIIPFYLNCTTNKNVYAEIEEGMKNERGKNPSFLV